MWRHSHPSDLQIITMWIYTTQPSGGRARKFSLRTVWIQYFVLHFIPIRWCWLYDLTQIANIYRSDCGGICERYWGPSQLGPNCSNMSLFSFPFRPFGGQWLPSCPQWGILGRITHRQRFSLDYIIPVCEKQLLLLLLHWELVPSEVMTKWWWKKIKIISVSSKWLSENPRRVLHGLLRQLRRVRQRLMHSNKCVVLWLGKIFFFPSSSLQWERTLSRYARTSRKHIDMIGQFSKVLFTFFIK